MDAKGCCKARHKAKKAQEDATVIVIHLPRQMLLHRDWPGEVARHRSPLPSHMLLHQEVAYRFGKGPWRPTTRRVVPVNTLLLQPHVRQGPMRVGRIHRKEDSPEREEVDPTNPSPRCALGRSSLAIPQGLPEEEIENKKTARLALGNTPQLTEDKVNGLIAQPSVGCQALECTARQGEIVPGHHDLIGRTRIGQQIKESGSGAVVRFKHRLVAGGRRAPRPSPKGPRNRTAIGPPRTHTVPRRPRRRGARVPSLADTHAAIAETSAPLPAVAPSQASPD